MDALLRCDIGHDFLKNNNQIRACLLFQEFPEMEGSDRVLSAPGSKLTFQVEMRQLFTNKRVAGRMILITPRVGTEHWNPHMVM